MGWGWGDPAVMGAARGGEKGVNKGDSTAMMSWAKVEKDTGLPKLIEFIQYSLSTQDKRVTTPLQETAATELIKLTRMYKEGGHKIPWGHQQWSLVLHNNLYLDHFQFPPLVLAPSL